MLFKYSLVALIALVGSVSCFPENRIVNGIDTDVTKHPSIVSIRGASGSHVCGASIIAPRWILTAAHCVMRLSPSEVTVQYATTEVSANGTNVANVKRIIMHENYTPAKFYANDIALLELEHSLLYNYNTIAPAILPDPFFEIPQTKEGTPGVSVGWGANTSFGDPQSQLQEVNLKIYSDEECKSLYNGPVNDGQICGGVDEGGKGICNGDSGGPLFYNGSEQLGIVSLTILPCGSVPAVYTKVSHYIDWMRNQMN